MYMAQGLADYYKLRDLKKAFDQHDQKKRNDFMFLHWRDFIAEFIGATESRRPAMLRRIFSRKPKDGFGLNEGCFIVFCIIMLERIVELIDQRENYELSVHLHRQIRPGGGYRETCAGISYLIKANPKCGIHWPDDSFDEVDDPSDGDDDSDDNDGGDHSSFELIDLAVEQAPGGPSNTP